MTFNTYSQKLQESRLVGGIDLEKQVKEQLIIKQIFDIAKKFETMRVPPELKTISMQLEDPYIHTSAEVSISVFSGVSEDKPNVLGDIDKSENSIYLFLGTIKAYAEQKHVNYYDLIRSTFIHELTHLIDPTPDEGNRREINALMSTYVQLIVNRLKTPESFELIDKAIRASDGKFVDAIHHLVGRGILNAWYKHDRELIKTFRQKLTWYLQEYNLI